MNTKNRITTIRLLNKLEQHPKYAERLGVSAQIKKSGTTENNMKGVMICRSEKQDLIAE